jgi:DNA-directed RNA polymerase subunit RPC12/RpoP
MMTMGDTPATPKNLPAKPPERLTAVQGVACRRCGSKAQQLLHEAPRLTLFKCADCGWRYAQSR